MQRRQFLASLGLTSTATTNTSLLLASAFGSTALASADSPLESQVNSYIKGLRRQGKVSGIERTAWSVYDLTAKRSLVSINESVPLQAASMVKPLVCQAFFYLAQHEGFIYGPKTRALMEAMIRRSSNTATNKLINIVGGPKRCNQILNKYGRNIFRQTKIVELIPAGGRTYKNRASAADYRRFLQAVWANQLPGAKEMRRLMNLSNNDRFKTGANAVPSNVSVFDKTGSTSALCGDMGVLVAKGRDGRRYPYIVVAIIERQHRTKNYGSWIKHRGNVIRGVSGIVYKYMKRQYPLT
jgi:beta-lactamase class A